MFFANYYTAVSSPVDAQLVNRQVCQAVQHFTCSAAGVLRGHRYHTLITACFSHESFWHLFGNMLGLYFFGGELIAFLGVRTFLNMYLGSGLVSSAAQMMQSYYARSRDMMLGASGCVNSCIAYSVLQWPSRLVFIYGIIPVPAILFGGLIMFQDVFGMRQAQQGYPGSHNIGYVSHVTGALCGAGMWMLTRGRYRRF